MLFVILLFLPLAGAAHQVSEESGVILIVLSYNPDTRRMSNFILEFESRIVSSGIPYDIYIENLECRGVADAQVWMRHLDNVVVC